MGYIYAYHGTRCILFALCPRETNSDDRPKRRALIADAKGMGYTKAHYSPVDKGFPSRPFKV